MTAMPLLQVKNISKVFSVKLQSVYAVNGVEFSIEPGETLGLVGESGCGKSTVGKIIVALTTPTTGDVLFENQSLPTLMRSSKRRLRNIRRHLQMIFQNPQASLNSRMTVREIIREPLVIHGLASRSEVNKRVEEMLHTVGLDKFHLNAFPHELSGGQRQRIGIARALITEPKLVICDEPFFALDVSIQAQVVTLLQSFQQEKQIAYLFIAHNLALVTYLAHRVLVLYLGSMMELAPSDVLHKRPLHPYTQSLFASILSSDPRIEKQRCPPLLQGDIPTPINLPKGCVFSSRCPQAKPICQQVVPKWKEVEKGHFVACHLY